MKIHNLVSNDPLQLTIHLDLRLSSYLSSSYTSSNGQRPTTGRLKQNTIMITSAPSFSIVISDGNVSAKGKHRCDDGSDETIASPNISEKAVLKAISRFEAITPIAMHEALSNSAQPETFPFLRKWGVPRVDMELSAGRIALHIVTFLV